MIKHIVLWKLKDVANGFNKFENAKKIKTELEGLRGRIAEISMLEVGLNFNDSAVAYDVALYSEFESREALDIYQQHPEHVRVAALINQVRQERVVVDYEI